jgi:hypothetical protein
MHLIGTIRFNSRLSISGHPGMTNGYIFNINKGIEYHIYADKISDYGYDTSIILITPDPHPGYSMASSGFTYITNGAHGGLMLCDYEDLKAAFDIDEIDEYNDDISFALHNWEPMTFGGWKSNIKGGNVIFIPSDEYFRVYQAEKSGKYIITCRNSWEDAEFAEKWPSS